MKVLWNRLCVALVLIFALCLSLAACNLGNSGGGTGGGSGEEPPKVSSEDTPLELEEVEPHIIGTNDSFIGDYILTANSTADSYIAIENSDIQGNKILNLRKTNFEANTPLTLDVRVPEFSGEWFTFSTDVTVVNSVNTHTVLDISLGRMYNLRFVSYNGAILVCDFNASGFVNLLDTAADVGETFTVSVIFSNGEGVTRNEEGEMIDNDMQAFVYINGKCIAKSINFYSERHLQYDQYDTIHYSIPKDTEANVYLDNIVTSKKYDPEGLVDNPPLTVDIPDARSFWDDRLRTYIEIMGEDGAEEFILMCERMYNEDLYEWISTLYDPDTGAFYFAESARDNFGYYPQAENVQLAMNIIVMLGIVDSTDKVLAWEQMTKIASWAQLAHSNRDGYFYHPQWGTDVNATRRNEDINQFEWIINNYGFGEYFFSDAYYRAGRGGQAGKLYPITYKVTEGTAQAVARVVAVSDVTLAGMYDSADELISALDKKWEDVGGNSFEFGKYLNSSSILRNIARRGLSETCINWLDNKQNEAQAQREKEGNLHTGLWDAGTGFESMSAVYHISAVYSYLGGKIKDPKDVINSLITYISGDVDEAMAAKYGMDYAYALLTSIAQVLEITEYHDYACAQDIFRNTIRTRAKALILGAEKHLSLFKKADGSYSWYPETAGSNYKNIVASVPGVNEGDLYASYVSFTVRDRLLRIFKLPNHSILTPYADDVSFDVDGDGVKETNGHLARFQELLWDIDITKKNMLPYDYEGINIDFSSEAHMPVNNYPDALKLSIVDGALLMNDVSNVGGAHVSFAPTLIDSSEPLYGFRADVKTVELLGGWSIPYQIFLHGLKLDMHYDKATETYSFSNVYYLANNTTETKTKLLDEAGEEIKVNATEWFTYDVVLYPDGRTDNGEKVYGYATFTQGTTKQVAKIYNLRDATYTTAKYNMHSSSSFYSLNGNVGKIMLDNVRVVVGECNVGNYNFDRTDEVPIGVSGGEMVLGRDNMYAFGDGAVSFDALTANGSYNFNEAQFALRYPTAKSGEKTVVNLKDANGKVIISLVLEHSSGYVTVKHAVSMQTLLIVPADPAKDLTIRVEYHYDLDTPTLDVIARYVDEPSGHSLVKPASLKGVPLTDPEADAASYAVLEIVAESELVYVDDAYVRNVRKP